MTTIQKKESLFHDWAGILFDTGSLLSRRFPGFDGIFEIAASIPSVNITENEKEFRIEMAVPGLDRKDLKVAVDNGSLSISSEKEKTENEEKKNYTRREYSYSGFKRSFTLPDNCLAGQIDANYDKGILHITLPKKENAVSPAKEIKVS